MSLGRRAETPFLLVGTSGYSYPHWKELLYRGVPARDWLPHYARFFGTVELDGTFYRLPSADSATRWAASTPGDFVFSCKGSRFITHMKQLRADQASIDRYFSPIERLGDKLGAVLWQLPPRMARPDLPRLAAFLEMLPPEVRYAVEFRDTAWYRDDVCDLLDRYRVAFCEHDLLAIAPPRVTGGFRYIRFHGTAAAYRGRYGPRALARVAGDLRAWREKKESAFIYFNNDSHGDALYDAVDLCRLLGAESELELARRPLGRPRATRLPLVATEHGTPP
jgi:uncharacterized protein YecE (DUF72 family)